jgi:hypothetical protein
LRSLAKSLAVPASIQNAWLFDRAEIYAAGVLRLNDLCLVPVLVGLSLFSAVLHEETEGGQFLIAMENLGRETLQKKSGRHVLRRLQLTSFAAKDLVSRKSREVAGPT